LGKKQQTGIENALYHVDVLRNAIVNSDRAKINKKTGIIKETIK